MQKLVQGVHQFQSHAFASRRELFAGLAHGQDPHTLFITCSDSRINPALLTQSEPGDLFILRNPGNLIPGHLTGCSGEAAGIEYALGALAIEHIVVCGHSHCGAMKALLSPEDAAELPSVAAWLSHASQVRKLIQQNYEGDRALADLLNITIQENVLVQLENLRTHPVVAQRLKAGRLHLHGWVYKLETGEVFAFDPAAGQFLPMVDYVGAGHTVLPRIGASP